MKSCYTSLTQRVLEIAAWLFWAASLAVAIYGMQVLPSRIATHFGLNGTPDGYGSPASLLLLPIIMAPSLGLLSLVAHFLNPECYNMPFKVREENKIPVYRCILTMLYAIELEISIFTFYTQIKSYDQSGKGILAPLGVFIAAMAVTILYACKMASRYNQHKP